MGVHGVKAVFFDLDNTLVDTAAAGRRAIEEVRGGGRGAGRRCPGGGVRKGSAVRCRW